MNLFAEDYRRLVVPQLRNLSRAMAACIKAEVSDFDDAYCTVLKHARILGAFHLPEDKLYELEDWIASNLLREIHEAGRVSAP